MSENFEEMFQQFATQFVNEPGSDGITGETPPVDEPDETTPPPDEEPEEEPEDDQVEVSEGVKLSKQRLAELAQFDSYLNENPDIARSLAESKAALDLYRSTSPVPAPGASAALPDISTSKPPADLDLDDPGIKWLYDRYQELHQSFQSEQQANYQRIAADTNSQAQRALTDWNSRYHLSDDDFRSVQQRAADLNVAPASMAQGKSAYDSITSALDSAFWTLPTLRQKFLSAQAASNQQRAKADRSKQQKLASLAGKGSITAPRIDPAQMTPEQRREAMAAEIAEHLARS